jgi:HAD superfamily hydrolase (TIGR01490 family)
MVGDKSKRSKQRPSTCLVFVDIDNTLLPGAAVFLFALEAWRNNLLSFSQVVPAMFEQRHFKRRGESDQRVASIQERALSLIRGHRVEEFDRVARLTFERRISKRLFPEVIKVLRAHLDAGHKVFLISASPQGLVDVIAEQLGLTGGVGTGLDVNDGVFTGELSGSLLRGDGKRLAARALADTHGAELSECYALADSMADLSLLESVGHPMAINPDQALQREALTRNWPVVWPQGTHRYRRLRT